MTPPLSIRFSSDSSALFRAFSIIELLGVVAIVGALSCLVVPSIQSLLSSGKMTQGAYEAGGLLEFARNEALGRQTYVWVAFQNVETSSGAEVRMAAAYSADGSGTNTASDNLLPLSRVLRIPDAVLSSWNDLKANTRGLWNSDAPQSVASNREGVVFSVGGTRFDAGSTLTFTPRGEVLLKGDAGPHDGYNPEIDVSFRQVRGSHAAVDADDVALLVDGPTGAVQTLRIQ